MTFCLGLIIARILIVAALTVIKELTNQIFQHHGGLGVLDSAAVFKDSRPEVRVFKTDVQRQVLLAQQARGADRQRTGIRDMVVALIDIELHAWQIGFRIERNVRYPPHYHAADAHRRTRLQAADVIESRIKAISRLGA